MNNVVAFQLKHVLQRVIDRDVVVFLVIAVEICLILP